MKQLIVTLQEELAGKLEYAKSFIQRDIDLPPVHNKIHVVIGMRRTGKTSFLLQKMLKLLNNKTPSSRILYINFEDDRLLPADEKKLAELVDAFYSLYPENHDQQCFLFFDEIQNVTNWPQIIRRLFDTKKVEIFLTGSSAKLLSKEIASALRGRAIATEIWPFSFKEFLRAKAKQPFRVGDAVGGPLHSLSIANLKPPFSKNTHDKLKNLFLEYLHTGGFPEIFHYQETERLQVLQDYVDVVIFRDIVERYHITNIALIKYMIKSLLLQTASLFSINKFYNDLKSQGFKIGRATLYDYLSYIEDAFLAFNIPLYAESLRKTHTNPRKIYAIDPGVVNAFTLDKNRNIGRLLENVVYLDLIRKGHQLYYYLTKDRYEIDFLVKTLTGKIELYQVAATLDDASTLDREQRALIQAQKELGVKGKLITLDSYIELALE